METIGLGNIITLVLVLLGFVGNAMYLKGSFGERIKTNERNITELWDKTRLKETCEEMFNGLGKRIDRVENAKR